MGTCLFIHSIDLLSLDPATECNFCLGSNRSSADIARTKHLDFLDAALLGHFATEQMRLYMACVLVHVCCCCSLDSACPTSVRFVTFSFGLS